MKNNTGYFQEIKLIPTKFCVDVWVCNDMKQLSLQFNKRYGASAEYYYDETTRNQVCTLTATDKSELKGITRIVMNINSWNVAVIVHEIIHVVYHLSKQCQLDMGYDSQEWVAYYAEYLFEQMTDKKNYKPIIAI